MGSALHCSTVLCSIIMGSPSNKFCLFDCWLGFSHDNIVTCWKVVGWFSFVPTRTKLGLNSSSTCGLSVNSDDIRTVKAIV